MKLGSSWGDPERSDAGVVEKNKGLTVGHNGFECPVYGRVHHSSDQVSHSFHRNFRRHLFLVRTSGGHRIVDLYRADNPGTVGYGLTGKPVGIAEAIPALVMAPHESDHILEVHQWCQDLGAHCDVLLDVLELCFGERPLFVEDILSD